jgi:SpoVK/Ycf46/Vps4 family AAA+-type ATPase
MKRQQYLLFFLVISLFFQVPIVAIESPVIVTDSTPMLSPQLKDNLIFLGVMFIGCLAMVPVLIKMMNHYLHYVPPIKADTRQCKEEELGYDFPEQLQPLLFYAAMSKLERKKIDLDNIQTNIMLSGEPGSGKTVMARHLAKTLKVKPIYITTQQIRSYWVSADGTKVADFYAQAAQEARKKGICVLIFDDCEDLFKDRSMEVATARSNDNGSRAAFLTTLDDGAKKDPNALVVSIFITNCIGLVDPAIKRDGRIAIVKVKEPPLAVKMDIFEKALRKTWDKIKDFLPENVLSAFNIDEFLVKKRDSFAFTGYQLANIKGITKRFYASSFVAAQRAKNQDSVVIDFEKIFRKAVKDTDKHLALSGMAGHNGC